MIFFFFFIFEVNKKCNRRYSFKYKYSKPWFQQRWFTTNTSFESRTPCTGHFFLKLNSYIILHTYFESLFMYCVSTCLFMGLKLSVVVNVFLFTMLDWHMVIVSLFCRPKKATKTLEKIGQTGCGSTFALLLQH